jgi:protein DGCR14
MEKRQGITEADVARQLELLPKKKQKKVVSEEEYLEGMERIIIEQFFPDLDKLRTEEEYLNAAAARDINKMRELELRAMKLEEQSQLPEPVKVSLDRYLANVTSEDDYSFEQIVQRENAIVRAKIEKIYNRPINAALLLNSNSSQGLLTSNPSNETSQTNQTKKSLESSNPALLLEWRTTANNELMSIPEGLLPATHEDLSQPPKEIVHQNTRFLVPTNPARKPDSQDSNSNASLQMKPDEELTADELLEKWKQLKKSEGHIDLAMLKSGQLNGANTSASLSGAPNRIAVGSGFVTTPLIRPGVDMSPLMTWGTIDATPLRLDPSATPIREFTIADEPEREKLAKQLSEATSFGIFGKAKTPQRSHTPQRTPLKKHTKKDEFGLSSAYRSPAV